jgi:hypothetical protein
MDAFGDRSGSGGLDGPAGRGTGDLPSRSALPPRGPAAELPEAPGPGLLGNSPSDQHPGTGWGSRRAARGAADDWPTTAPRDRSDTPRGHEDVEATGQFAHPDLGGPPARPTGTRPGGRGGDTGEFPWPGSSGPQQQDTGQYALPPSELDAPSPASVPSDDRTPLFDTLESDWFRGHSSGDRAATEASPPPRPVQPSTSSMQPMQPMQPMPPREPARGSQNDSDPAWRPSPNDELGRQAERVRQPAAGGITTSGLPRRVPRANLVAGTATQDQTQPIGPQVSRAPDDVRGRLTNLRRGIQKGREAGSDSHGSNSQGFGRTYQQER